MITTEYSVAGPVHISIAIVADLHEFEPKPVLSRLSEIRPDVIVVPFEYSAPVEHPGRLRLNTLVAFG